MAGAGAVRRGGAASEEEAVAHSMCLMVNILHKTFVARVAELSRLRDWRGLWLSTLQAPPPHSCIPPAHKCIFTPD